MKILIIDDEPEIVAMITKFLRSRGFSNVTGETKPEKALDLIEKSDFDVIICDLVMKPISGMDILDKVLKYGVDFIMMTAHASVQNAVLAMQKGACDYIVKPFSLEELLVRLKKIIKRKELERENDTLKKTNIVFHSEAMKKVMQLVDNVASYDFPVLITGETGVGKTLIAESIHTKSKRNKWPFISLNVGSIPDTLLESELFGYEKGAFTGANVLKKGFFELANNGTLFLDEIGDISGEVQVKLLKVLESGRFFRLGGKTYIDVNIRLITATNRNIMQEVEQGTFRRDLYYRISVFPINVPPLRERKEDIPGLVHYYLKKFNYEGNVTNRALKILTEHSWPGNIRELINVLKRAVVLAGDDTIDTEHIIIENFSNGNVMQVNEMEKKMIVRALEKANGNKKKAAEILGISRKMLYTRLKKYGIGE